MKRRSFKDASACLGALHIPSVTCPVGVIGLLGMTGEAVALLYPSRANNTIGALDGPPLWIPRGLRLPVWRELRVG